MRVAVIGSRSLNVDIANFIPPETTMIISGGAKGIDTLVENYADEQKIPKIIFKPDYQKYGRVAPIIRNKDIVDSADIVVAVWNGYSMGTKYTIDYAKRCKKDVRIFTVEED